MEAVIALAGVGLFLPDHRNSLADARQRDYSIRLAREEDISELSTLESTCWGDLSLSPDHIRKRLSNYPRGQWVAVVGTRVVGVMYTQRLVAESSLLQPAVMFANQEDQHCTTGGRVIQLLGVAVLPEFGHLQIGTALRDFVIQLGHLDADMESVIAMTRCSSATNDEIDYIRKVQACDDPTLQFHVSAGAQLVQAVPNFRPNDRINFGHGVLIRYDLRKTSSSLRTATSRRPELDTFMTVAELKEMLHKVLEGPQAKAVNALSDQAFLDRPFMELGLHSLAIMELRVHLMTHLKAQGSERVLSPTVLFDNPTPRKLLQHLSGLSDDQTGTAAATEKESGKHSDRTAFAICGMGCRFPGGIRTPDEFHQALLGGLDAVKSVPKEWNWDAQTKYAAFLSEDFAETFDASFFKISAAEAQQMDPHQRILLEVAHEALTTAGVLNGGDTQQVRKSVFLVSWADVAFVRTY
jgi:hypothetical protein